MIFRWLLAPHLKIHYICTDQKTIINFDNFLRMKHLIMAVFAVFAAIPHYASDAFMKSRARLFTTDCRF